MSSSSGNRRKPIYCDCPDVCVLRISRTPENPGRKFWACPNYKKNGGCGFFQWACEEEDSNDEVGKKSNFSQSKKEDTKMTKCDEVRKMSKFSQSKNVLNQSELREIKSLLEGMVGLLVVISVLVFVIVLKM